MADPTQILQSLEADERASADELFPLVYGELRRLAAAKMAGERAGHTLQPTALVHEVWLKLAGPSRDEPRWNGQRHFCAAAAEAMRRILIDHARRKLADRRGGNRMEITFGDPEAPTAVSPAAMIDLSNALAKLAELDREKAEVANLRLFAGLTVVEIAGVQGISEATAKRRWSYVRAWLGRELRRGEENPELA